MDTAENFKSEAQTTESSAGAETLQRLRATEISAPVALALPLGFAKPVEAAIDLPSTEMVIQPVDQASMQNGRAGKVLNPMLALLAKSENDLAGLVAYGFYKLSKRDWLDAFREAHRRGPSEAELDAFIIGEGTPRRIAAYRQQAEAALSRAASPVEPPDLPPSEEPISTSARPRMATIFHQLTRTPLSDPPTDSAGKRLAKGLPQKPGQPSPQLFLRYLLILTGLVICLAILMNWAKSTIFLN